MAAIDFQVNIQIANGFVFVLEIMFGLAENGKNREEKNNVVNDYACS